MEIKENKVNKRSANWGETERCYAVELILENSSVIHGKFRGASEGAKEKGKVWQVIADQLNASGQASCQRTAVEIKKMFGNMKSRAKEKYDTNTKTGGGPQVKLTPTEQLIIDHLLANNSSQLKGIESGIDSLSNSDQMFSSSLFDNLTVLEVFEGNNIIDRNNNTVETMPARPCCSGDATSNTKGKHMEKGRLPLNNLTNDVDVRPVPITDQGASAEQTRKTPQRPFKDAKKQKTTRRIMDEREDDLYDLERKRILLDIEILEEKKKQQQELFILQKQLIEKQLKA